MSVQVTGDLFAVHVMVLVILDIGSLAYVLLPRLHHLIYETNANHPFVAAGA